MASSGVKPAQILRKLVSISRCREKEFTTYSSWFVTGALKKKDRYDKTGPRLFPLTRTRLRNSPRITKSIIIGVASSESSHTL